MNGSSANSAQGVFRSKTLRLAIIIICTILLVDQSFKVYVKTHFEKYQKQDVLPAVLHGKMQIRFIENEGMAYGWKIAKGPTGKITLSIFRLVATCIFIYAIYYLNKNKYPKKIIISVSLVSAGALGNIFDTAFYGLLFTESTQTLVAEFSPGNGYAPFLMGNVVDMLHFPLWQGLLPSWVPIWGGEYTVIFRPVFNIADVSIFIGALLLLFYHRLFIAQLNKLKSTEKDV